MPHNTILGLMAIMVARAAKLSIHSACSSAHLRTFSFAPYSNKDVVASNTNSAEHRFVRAYAESCRKDASLLVDVGGNRGEFTALLAQFWPNASLHVFEVMSKNVHLLQRRMRGMDHVTIHHMAMAQQPASEVAIMGLHQWLKETDRNNGARTRAAACRDCACVLQPPLSLLTSWLRNCLCPCLYSVCPPPSLWARWPRNASACPLGRHEHARAHNTAVLERVPATSLDAFFGALPFGASQRLAFLKIDAEGMDGPILAGAPQLLSSGRVDLIFFENNRVQVAANWSLLDSVLLLRNHGYEAYLFGEQHLLQLADLCPQHPIFNPKAPTLNIVAWPARAAFAETLLGKYKMSLPPAASPSSRASGGRGSYQGRGGNYGGGGGPGGARGRGLA